MKLVYRTVRMPGLRMLLAFCLLIGFSGLSAAAQPQLTAEEAVNQYITSLLGRINEIKPEYDSNREAYFADVEKALEGFVDFREVARGVMAKYGTGPNGATDAQLDRFAKVFKRSMVEFYGSALASYGGQSFEFVKNKQPPSDPENATNIRMLVKADDGSRFELQYTMFLNRDKVWKLKNLYVEGVNLRRQYYSRFDDLMSRNNYDIDKVIDVWQSSE